MSLGNTLAMWNNLGLLEIRIRTVYKAPLNRKAPTIIAKLKEKMITKREATIHIISKANRGKGSPKMTAPFRMFL